MVVLAYFYKIWDFLALFGDDVNMTSFGEYGMVTWLLTQMMRWQRTRWRGDGTSG